MSTRASHNEKARIAESYNQLYSQFCSDEVSEVGNYAIQRLIGEGAFGKVYLAVHKLTHTKVVLKTGAKSDPNLVREVFYHRQFKHPHITRLFEVIVAPERIWLVLEWCPGRELYDYVVRSGRISVDECARLFSQITSAVHYAHSLNCIHRDLKLENILLDKRRNAKLSDFGFTRECDQRTLLETVCGTTVYMAPELLKKEKYDGFKIDTWSLGVILYTMVYGQMPFDEEDEARTQIKIIEEEPIYNEGIPVEAIVLMKKLLNKDPQQRPTTAEILMDPFLDVYGPHLLEQSSSLVKSMLSQKYFYTKTERNLLKKLKSLGFDTHSLQKSVIDYKCDSLSGLWELLLEKEKKKEAKKYKTRSRSVLRITESTSRRVSQFMDPISTPQLSRVVSRLSTASNQPRQSTPTFNNYDIHSVDNQESLSSPEKKKKSNFIQKFTKFWKINKKEELLNSEMVSPLGSRRATSFNSQDLPSTTNHTMTHSQSQGALNPSSNGASNTKKSIETDHPEAEPEPITPANKLTIHEPRSPTSRSAKGTIRRSSRPRPVSMVSQHSLASQFTTMSDVSLASEHTSMSGEQRGDQRPQFLRKLSSEACVRTARRSLSLISSNSSASDRSSRKGSLYDTSTSSSYRVHQLSLRGRRQDSVFPKTLQRRHKSPLGGIPPRSSRFKKNKPLVIQEQNEESDEVEDLETDIENLGLAESTRKSSDFEDMDDESERGRKM